MLIGCLPLHLACTQACPKPLHAPSNQVSTRVGLRNYSAPEHASSPRQEFGVSSLGLQLILPLRLMIS